MKPLWRRGPDYPTGSMPTDVKFNTSDGSETVVRARTYPREVWEREDWRHFLGGPTPISLALSVVDGATICSAGPKRGESVMLSGVKNVEDFVTLDLSDDPETGKRRAAITLQYSPNGPSLMTANWVVGYLQQFMDPATYIQVWDISTCAPEFGSDYSHDPEGVLHDGRLDAYDPSRLETPLAQREHLMTIIGMTAAGF